MTWEKGLRPAKICLYCSQILVETFDLGKGIKTRSTAAGATSIWRPVETFDLGKGIKTHLILPSILKSLFVETFDLGKGIKTHISARLFIAAVLVETFDLGKGIKTWYDR